MCFWVGGSDRILPKRYVGVASQIGSSVGARPGSSRRISRRRKGSETVRTLVRLVQSAWYQPGMLIDSTVHVDMGSTTKDC